MTTKEFQKIIRAHYKKHKREFPWRKTRDPYRILVSEIMLQQTQAHRVLPKYKSFVKKFPTVEALARGKLSVVLNEWQGLGYNRRALYLKRTAETIHKNFSGKFPKDFKTLSSLPGVGPVTAGDIMAFAWNAPVSVIETNVRSVFIHFFFNDRKNIPDKKIIPLIEKTLDRKNPREWYYALFDYGVYIKKTGNPSRRSAHYVKQSRFEGSHRQKRAQVLKMILNSSYTKAEISKRLGYAPEILSRIIFDLKKEGFIQAKNRRYHPL